MTKLARLTEADEDGVRHVIETLEVEPQEGMTVAQTVATMFHPSLVDQWVQVPNATTQRSTKHGSSWTHRDAPET